MDFLMVDQFKQFVRNLSINLGLDLTQNLRYDRLTGIILKKCLHPNSNCIDVGSHKGELLQEMLRLAPEGQHYAFEPLPHLYVDLKNRFGDLATVLPFALSSHSGSARFQFVKGMPAYSGLRRRSYEGKSPEIEEIEVEKRTLDEVLPSSYCIDFMKIDVEGAEMDVLKGAKAAIRRSQPILLFECGLGANDHYGYDASKVFEVLGSLDLVLNTLDQWIHDADPLNYEDFNHLYTHQAEYYFIAYK